MTKQELYKIVEEYILSHKEAHYRIAYSYVRNKEDALDIIQESIYKALASIASLENPKAIKTWFYRILVNTSVDFIRKNSRIIYVEEPEIATAQEDHYENIDLEKALDYLPPEQRIVIILRFFEDLKLEDVAAALGENLSTVKSRLYAGLKKLRIAME